MLALRPLFEPPRQLADAPRADERGRLRPDPCDEGPDTLLGGGVCSRPLLGHRAAGGAPRGTGKGLASAAVDAWLADARDALAEATGLPRERLDLSGGDVAVLLDLARIAAHESGERTNAPLLCYLVGRAQGDADLGELADAVRRSTA